MDALLDPLALLGLLLFIYVLYRAVKVGVKRIWPAAGFAALLLMVSAPAIVNPLIASYEAIYPEQSCAASEVLPIVLLGGGVDGRATSPEQIAYLHSAGYKRTVKASDLALASPDAPVYVSGGIYRDVAEAEVMAHLLRRLGVPSAQLRLETESANTFENAKLVAKLMGEEVDGEARTIRLVTSAVHMPRAAAVFEAVGLRVCAVPAEYVGLKQVPWMALLPQSSALVKTAAFSHELIGWVFYKLSGRL